MAYFPGHDYWVRYAPSTSVISNTTGLITGTPALGTALDLGYTNPGSVVINDNARKGYAPGRRGASYSAKGWREIEISIPIRIGLGEFIATYCLPDGDLPEIDIFYGASDDFARCIHRAKCARVSVNLPLNEGSEITAVATFFGQAYSNLAAVTANYDYEEFGPALLASDVRSLLIDSGATDILSNTMNLSFDVDYQLERKYPGRNEFGNNVPGSRTTQNLLQHHQIVNGSITIHDLPSIESTLFYGGATNQAWGAITALINDVAVSKEFDFVLNDVEPVSRNQNEIESGAELTWTIPFIASEVTVTADDLIA